MHFTVSVRPLSGSLEWVSYNSVRNGGPVPGTGFIALYRHPLRFESADMSKVWVEGQNLRRGPMLGPPGCLRMTSDDTGDGFGELVGNLGFTVQLSFEP